MRPDMLSESLGSSPGVLVTSLLRSLLLLLLFAAPVGARSQQVDASAIRGVVNDTSGKPVADAAVSLQPSNLTTRTDAHGSFAFVNVKPGRYLLRADKGDLHARQLTGEETPTPITLVLSAESERSGNMEFTDKPNFTVAGITDWTAVGGHGSDASLRTSESLAREAATLTSSGADAAPVEKRENELRAVAAASPNSFVANRDLGRFCLQSGRYRDAVPPLETAFRIDPSDAKNEHDLALAYKGSGDLTRAQEHIRHLLAHDNTAEVHRLAGDLDEALGDALSAEHEYETAVHLDPNEANTFTWGAELLLHRAVWPAIEVFRKGAATYPKSARMLSALGVALFASAQYEEAAPPLCSATQVNPHDPVPYTFLGEIEIASPVPLGCAEQALADFTREQPTSARAKYYYAMAILKRQGMPPNPTEVEDVRSLLMKAVELDPNLGEAYLQLGILMMNKKEYRQAIDLFTKAIQANPNLGDAHYRLGVAYQRIGQAAEAREQFERHDAIEKAQAEEVERQRTQVKQFMVVLQDQSPAPK
jgi:tetratricopeptide (TPR) repeat protein